MSLLVHDAHLPQSRRILEGQIFHLAQAFNASNPKLNRCIQGSGRFSLIQLKVKIHRANHGTSDSFHAPSTVRCLHPEHDIMGVGGRNAGIAKPQCGATAFEGLH
eukprot:scaffold1204_cov313-Pavlova_lutheri.AAC.3